MPNGVVIYRGPSEIDREPIIVVASGFSKNSNNPKLGIGLIQTWIIREDVDPVRAVLSGADAAICGGCIYRGTADGRKVTNRRCYVPVYYAPLSVWKSYRHQPEIPSRDLRQLFSGRGLRLGAYGDPAAVPPDIWRSVTDEAEFWTGYTHQWRTCDPIYARWCMASCDSHAERVEAKALGYRTFRVTEHDARLDRGRHEIVCPASAEMDHRTTCTRCRACGGAGGQVSHDVVITIHGVVAKRARKGMTAS